MSAVRRTSRTDRRQHVGVVAWYTCPRCGHDWSARLRNGRPDELWDHCYRGLLANTNERFNQEIRCLGGDYAHVLDESIDSRHDPMTNEAWLHGRFTYVLYRRGPRGTSV